MARIMQKSQNKISRKNEQIVTGIAKDFFSCRRILSKILKNINNCKEVLK